MGEWQFAKFTVPKNEVMEFIKEFTKLYYIRKISVAPIENEPDAHISIQYRERGGES